MAVRFLWLGMVGAIILTVGLCLAVARLRQFYPGLVIVVGCLCCAAFLLIHEAAWRPPSDNRDPPTHHARP